MITELMNHLWQSTLFAVAAGLLAIAFRKNRAQVRYWVWLSASLKFLVPFALLISFGSHLGWIPATKTSATKAASLTMVQIAQPFPDTLSLVRSAPRNTDWPLIAILGAWICGFGMIAFMRLRLWLRIRAAVRSSTPLEIPGSVEVRSSPGLLEPGVVGLFRSVLLLPEGIIERLTPPQLDAVLAHEMCHIRRRDNLTAAIHMIVEAIFWFHPLVWWIGVELVTERERACDEEVLRLGSEPQVYAEGILRVCKFYAESPLTCVAGVTGPNLRKRVERIMRNHVGKPLNTGRKLFLVMAGVVTLALPIVFGLLNSTPSRAQSQTESTTAMAPVFGVASIKPSKAGGIQEMVSIQYTPDGLVLTNVSLRKLIQLAFGVQEFQITEGPNWLDSERYDVDAKMEKSVSDEMQKLGWEKSKPEHQHMLQVLLVDRFKLTLHRETKELPLFALTIAENGPKFQQAKPGDTYPDGLKASDGKPIGPGAVIIGPGQLTLQSAQVTTLVQLLSEQLRKTVVDKTGITGKYDFTMRWTPDQSTLRVDASHRPADAPLPDSSGPSIFVAIQEQLGLKLESQKGPVEVLVIDHVEKPSTAAEAESLPTKTAAFASWFEASSKPNEYRLSFFRAGEAVLKKDLFTLRKFISQYTLDKQIDPLFETVSIKPDRTGIDYQGLKTGPDELTATNVTPQMLIGSAYGVDDNQIAGVADWVNSDRYDIEAKVYSGVADELRTVNPELVRKRMLQALLADRFDLIIHRETKEVPVYDLVIAKDGPKLQQSTPGDTYPHGRVIQVGRGQIAGQEVPVTTLARLLSEELGRTVRDKTGLPDHYAINLQWTPEENQLGMSKGMRSGQQETDNAFSPESSESSIFTAIQEQLGLKLEPEQVPMEFFVIDHVEAPSDN